VLDRVADKWSVLVLGLLAKGPRRFNQLRRQIEGLSQKMLSQMSDAKLNATGRDFCQIWCD
jgi:DNA-binding HxlR family transcriptional regulator